jgi:RHS repeat-associated protein
VNLLALIISPSRIGRKFGYDNAGNATSYTGDSFAFNDRGRMNEAIVGGSATNYIYNALGQLIEKYGNGGTTLLMYDEAGHILGEYSGTGALIEETVWMGDTPVATIRPSGSTIIVYYVHTDHLGTPRKVTRTSDNGLMWRWDPDTFGSVAPNTNPAGLGAFTYNLRFPGQFSLNESGLYYNYFRTYDPSMGRYLESDPIGLEGGNYSTYAYANNDPIDASDPYGLYTVLPGVPTPSPELQALLNCIGARTGQLLVVTSTSTISPAHPVGTPHARGVAVDVRYPSDPAAVLCAAGACGAGFALDEKQHPSAHSDGPHIHIQIPKGTKGGRGDLPPTGCSGSNCGT